MRLLPEPYTICQTLCLIPSAGLHLLLIRLKTDIKYKSYLLFAAIISVKGFLKLRFSANITTCLAHGICLVKFKSRYKFFIALDVQVMNLLLNRFNYLALHYMKLID